MQNLEKLAIDADLLSIDPGIQNVLDILINDYQNHAKLNDFGNFLVYKGLKKRLDIRLSMEIMNENRSSFKQDDPIFITGLPRSGTTFLFNLLALDKNHRSPKYWEIMSPLPLAKTDFDVKKRESTRENSLKEDKISKINQERRRKCISGQRPRNQ